VEDFDRVRNWMLIRLQRRQEWLMVIYHRIFQGADLMAGAPAVKFHWSWTVGILAIFAPPNDAM
jgi:hypothetical protein